MYETLVIPVFMYGSECWTLRKEDEHRIDVAEMNWLRRILRITWLHRMRNVDVRNRLQQEVTLNDRMRKTTQLVRPCNQNERKTITTKGDALLCHWGRTRGLWCLAAPQFCSTLIFIQNHRFTTFLAKLLVLEHYSHGSQLNSPYCSYYVCCWSLPCRLCLL